jgi:hypothetical protein
MAITKETTNYSGRTVDVSILQYPNSQTVDTQDVFPKFGKPSRFCAGVQKLIQRYVILMMTNVTSQEYYPDSGVSFLWPLQAGVAPLDNIAVQHIFTLADYSAVTTIKTYQTNNPDMPLDEQLANTQLVNVSLGSSYVAFSVKLTTLAGTNIDFLVPLPK